jgi:RNA polymerase sigma-70 factor (ECF subfamily)
MGSPALKENPDFDTAYWVKLAQSGNEEAFSALIEEHQENLFRFCVYLTGNKALSQDLCQDGFIKALEHLKTLQNPASFKSWLFQTTKNLYLNHVKSPRNSKYLQLEDVSDLCSEIDLGLVTEIRQCLEKLSPEERMVILLVDLEENSYSETAAILGVSEEAVRSRLHRARLSFKEKYK